MKEISALTRRNVKLFFKDKGTFFTSLITPAILLVLYATFLSNVYKESFMENLPVVTELQEKIINGSVAGQLVSSILAVSCVTVAFSANLLMVQDKANGTLHDLTITPVKSSSLALGYYFATLICTLLICYVAMGICLGYMAFIGWYMSVADVLLLALDVFILTMFGTALSSVIGYFLSSQGQISAVTTIMSAGYGFICGAYMPIATFGETLQKVVYFLPGTYGTALVRHHAMRGALQQMQEEGAPEVMVESIKESLDFYPKFFDHTVEIGEMYAILGVTIVVLIGIYLVQNMTKKKA